MQLGHVFPVYGSSNTHQWCQWFARVCDLQRMEHLTAALGEREEEHNTSWTHWDLVWFSDECKFYIWVTRLRKIWYLGPSTSPELLTPLHSHLPFTVPPLPFYCPPTPFVLTTSSLFPLQIKIPSVCIILWYCSWETRAESNTLQEPHCLGIVC